MKNRVRFADLHLHTMFSDGTFTPEEVVLRARRAGLSAISVTDHDTVEGMEQLFEAARDKDIEILPGIELTCECEGSEVHILGFLFDYKQDFFLDKLKFLMKNRVERVHKIIEKLKEAGVHLRAETVFDISGNGTPGRLHIARALVQEGEVTNIFEAFQKYIGERAPAYVLGFRFSVEEAINLIKRAKGIAVLAHPYSLSRQEFIDNIISSGIMGLEVYYPEHSQSHINYYLSLCKKYDLLVTGGSDCHGTAKPEVRIGSIKLPYELIERMKEYKRSVFLE